MELGSSGEDRVVILGVPDDDDPEESFGIGNHFWDAGRKICARSSEDIFGGLDLGIISVSSVTGAETSTRW